MTAKWADLDTSDSDSDSDSNSNAIPIISPKSHFYTRRPLSQLRASPGAAPSPATYRRRQRINSLPSDLEDLPSSKRHRSSTPAEDADDFGKEIVVVDDDDDESPTRGLGTEREPFVFREWVTGNVIARGDDGVVFVVSDDDEEEELCNNHDVDVDVEEISNDLGDDEDELDSEVYRIRMGDRASGIGKTSSSRQSAETFARDLQRMASENDIDDESEADDEMDRRSRGFSLSSRHSSTPSVRSISPRMFPGGLQLFGSDNGMDDESEAGNESENDDEIASRSRGFSVSSRHSSISAVKSRFEPVHPPQDDAEEDVDDVNCVSEDLFAESDRSRSSSPIRNPGYIFGSRSAKRLAHYDAEDDDDDRVDEHSFAAESDKSRSSWPYMNPRYSFGSNPAKSRGPPISPRLSRQDSLLDDEASDKDENEDDVDQDGQDDVNRENESKDEDNSLSPTIHRPRTTPDEPEHGGNEEVLAMSYSQETIGDEDEDEPVASQTERHIENMRSAPLHESAEDSDDEHVSEEPISLVERKRLFYTVYWKDMRPSLERRLKKYYSTLNDNRNSDECWLYTGACLPWRVKTQGMAIGIRFHHNWKLIVVSPHIVFLSMLLKGMLSEEAIEGIIEHGWHASHLCGNWTCLNERHIQPEPGPINQNRNGCLPHKDKPCYHVPACRKDLKVNASILRPKSYTPKKLPKAMKSDACNFDKLDVRTGQTTPSRKDYGRSPFNFLSGILPNI